MTQPMDVESEEFFDLLTEALRAGPGSPSWHQAVQILRTRQGDGEAEDYRLLCAAREHLESGRAYREVRAGPGFGRKVLDAIEELPGDGGSRRGVPLANVIAIVCAIGLLLVVLTLGYLLAPGSGQRGSIEELAQTSFMAAGAPIAFSGGEMPAGWRTIGPLALDAGNGLRLSGQDGRGAPAGEFRGGGIVWLSPMQPDEAFAVEVMLEVTRPADDLVAQVFVTDQPQFSEDRGTSPHELVWLLQGTRLRLVLPDGRGEAEETLGLPSASRKVLVRLRLGRDLAIIDDSGGRGGAGPPVLKRLWAGPHQLDRDAPRYVGVRFLRRGDSQANPISVQSIGLQRQAR